MKCTGFITHVPPLFCSLNLLFADVLVAVVVVVCLSPLSLNGGVNFCWYTQCSCCTKYYFSYYADFNADQDRCSKPFVCLVHAPRSSFYPSLPYFATGVAVFISPLSFRCRFPVTLQVNVSIFTDFISLHIGPSNQLTGPSSKVNSFLCISVQYVLHSDL